MKKKIILASFASLSLAALGLLSSCENNVANVEAYDSYSEADKIIESPGAHINDVFTYLNQTLEKMCDEEGMYKSLKYSFNTIFNEESSDYGLTMEQQESMSFNYDSNNKVMELDGFYSEKSNSKYSALNLETKSNQKYQEEEDGVYMLELNTNVAYQAYYDSVNEVVYSYVNRIMKDFSHESHNFLSDCYFSLKDDKMTFTCVNKENEAPKSDDINYSKYETEYLYQIVITPSRIKVVTIDNCNLVGVDGDEEYKHIKKDESSTILELSDVKVSKANMNDFVDTMGIVGGIL